MKLEKNNRMLIGKTFRDIRKDKNLHVVDIAKSCGRDCSYIYRFEKGTSNITIDNLLILCAALEIPVADLFKAYDSQHQYKSKKIIQPHMEIVEK